MEIIGLSARFCLSFASLSYGETVLYCSNKRQSRKQGVRGFLINPPGRSCLGKRQSRAALGYGDYWAFSSLLFEFCHTILWRNCPLLLQQAAKPITTFNIAQRANIQNSKLKISFADNSKFNTQNSKSALPIIQNSKLKIQNSTSHPSILFISILFASLTLEMSTESRYTSVVFMDLCPMPTLMTETGTFTFRATLAHVWRAT